MASGRTCSKVWPPKAALVFAVLLALTENVLFALAAAVLVTRSLPLCCPHSILPANHGCLLQGLADIDAEKQEVEAQLQECAEAAAKDLGLVLDKTLK